MLYEVITQPRVVAGDDAVALQPFDPLHAGGGGEPDPIGQFRIGDTPLLLQDGEDVAIDTVEFSLFLHNGLFLNFYSGLFTK